MELNKPKPFDPNKNKWQSWKQEFITYLRLSGGYKKFSEEERALLLLNLMGPISFEVMENFTFENPSDRNDMDILLVKFDEIFEPPTKEVEDRYKFFSRMLNENESFESYIADLQEKAIKCHFGLLAERFVIDQIIRNLDPYLRQMIFKQENITLDDMIASYNYYKVNAIKFKELAENENKTLNFESVENSNYVDGIPSTSKGKSKGCWRCSTTHRLGLCPAYGYLCGVCNEEGHLDGLCRKEKKKEQPNSASSKCGQRCYAAPQRERVNASSNKQSEKQSSSGGPDAPPSYFQATHGSATNFTTYDSAEYCRWCESVHPIGLCEHKPQCTSCNSYPHNVCFNCKHNPHVENCYYKTNPLPKINITRNANRYNHINDKEIEKTFVHVQHTRRTQHSQPRRPENQRRTRANKKEDDICCIS